MSINLAGVGTMEIRYESISGSFSFKQTAEKNIVR